MKYMSCLTLIISVACGTKVIHFLNTDAPFGQYKSYLILNFEAGKGQISAKGDTLMAQLEKVIQAEMTKRNYVESGKAPDLLLRYELASTTQTRTNVNQMPYSIYVDVNTRTFHETALLLEITDRKTKKLVWQGSTDMKAYSRKNKERDALQAAVTDIFRFYPYKALASKPYIPVGK